MRSAALKIVILFLAVLKHKLHCYPVRTTNPKYPAAVDYTYFQPTKMPSASGLGLLYAFSETSKRIPLPQLPHQLESATNNFGENFNKWCGEAVDKAEKVVMEVGGRMIDYLSEAATDVGKKAGDVFNESYHQMKHSLKQYISEWIGCRG